MVMAPVERHDGERWCLCICDCGGIMVTRRKSLLRERTRSCGCLLREQYVKNGKMNTRHGESGTVGTIRSTEYSAWAGMIARCNNRENRAYDRYGGRGIRVCVRWCNSYEKFLLDMGRKPTPKHSLDRIDNDKGYSPTNCRWATPHEQNLNKRNNRKLTIDGIALTVTEWVERSGMIRGTLWSRLEMGWSPKRAVSTPVRKIRRKHGA